MTTDQFEALQRKLVPLWRSIQQFSEDPQTIVVVLQGVVFHMMNALGEEGMVG